MFQTKVLEKIKTRFLYSITFLQNLAVYEIMWKDAVQTGWTQMSIRLIGILGT